jgi:hypothetical protein
MFVFLGNRAPCDLHDPFARNRAGFALVVSGFSGTG